MPVCVTVVGRPTHCLIECGECAGTVAEFFARVSEFAADQRARISELDVNPLICAGERIIAVDALIAKRKDDST